MALAYALAPEGVRRTAGKNCARVNSVEREHAGIPSAGNDADLTCLFRSRIYIREMLRNMSVCVKAVDDIVKGCVLGSLYGQVCRAAAAKDQYIHRNFLLDQRILAVYFDAGCLDRKTRGITACKDTDQLHIRIVADRLLNASAKVSVTENSYSNSHVCFLRLYFVYNYSFRNRKFLL